MRMDTFPQMANINSSPENLLVWDVDRLSPSFTSSGSDLCSTYHLDEMLTTTSDIERGNERVHVAVTSKSEEVVWRPRPSMMDDESRQYDDTTDDRFCGDQKVVGISPSISSGYISEQKKTTGVDAARSVGDYFDPSANACSSHSAARKTDDSTCSNLSNFDQYSNSNSTSNDVINFDKSTSMVKLTSTCTSECENVNVLPEKCSTPTCLTDHDKEKPEFVLSQKSGFDKIKEQMGAISLPKISSKLIREKWESRSRNPAFCKAPHKNCIVSSKDNRASATNKIGDEFLSERAKEGEKEQVKTVSNLKRAVDYKQRRESQKKKVSFSSVSEEFKNSNVACTFVSQCGDECKLAVLKSDSNKTQHIRNIRIGSKTYLTNDNITDSKKSSDHVKSQANSVLKGNENKTNTTITSVHDRKSYFEKSLKIDSASESNPSFKKENTENASTSMRERKTKKIKTKCDVSKDNFDNGQKNISHLKQSEDYKRQKLFSVSVTDCADTQGAQGNVIVPHDSQCSVDGYNENRIEYLSPRNYSSRDIIHKTHSSKSNEIQGKNAATYTNNDTNLMETSLTVHLNVGEDKTTGNVPVSQFEIKLDNSNEDVSTKSNESSIGESTESLSGSISKDDSRTKCEGETFSALVNIESLKQKCFITASESARDLIYKPNYSFSHIARNVSSDTVCTESFHRTRKTTRQSVLSLSSGSRTSHSSSARRLDVSNSADKYRRPAADCTSIDESEELEKRRTRDKVFMEQVTLVDGLNELVEKQLEQSNMKVYRKNYKKVRQLLKQRNIEVTNLRSLHDMRSKQLTDSVFEVVELRKQLRVKEEIIKNVCEKFLTLKVKKDEQSSQMILLTAELEGIMAFILQLVPSEAESEGSDKPSIGEHLVKEIRKSARLTHENTLLRKHLSTLSRDFSEPL